MAFNINTNVGEREAFICGLALSGGLDKAEQVPFEGIAAYVLEPVIIPVTSVINDNITAEVQIS